MKKPIALLLVLTHLFCAVYTQAQTIRDVACNSGAIASAITSSASGDTVRVAAGSCSITVTIPNTKGITLLGGFGGATTITTASGAITLNAGATTPGSRVSGFNFTGAGDLNNGIVAIITASNATTPRLDNNSFNNPSTGGTFVSLQGIGSILVDHNTFLGSSSGEFIHNFAAGAGNNAGWQDDITPGSANMVFIEDNTCQTPNGSFSFGNLAQNYYGSRTVMRHNVLKFCQIDVHGNELPKGRWWEIYDNTFFPMGQNQSNYMQLRGGSGVVFNNTVDISLGGNSGAGAIEFFEESGSTWPMAFQIGSGLNDTANSHLVCNGGASASPPSGSTAGYTNDSPVYAWNNAAAMTYFYTGPVQLNRDVFVSTTQPSSMFRYQKASDTRCSTTYSYTPYTYPHPSQNAGSGSSTFSPTSAASITLTTVFGTSPNSIPISDAIVVNQDGMVQGHPTQFSYHGVR